MSPRQVVIDACSALNLLALSRAADFLQALDWTLLVLPEVRQETRYLRGPLDDQGQPTRIDADWSALERTGRVTAPPSEKLGDAFIEALIQAAAHLTDVDASTVALAGTLRLPLFSDDGKVRKIFRALYPALELRATLGLIRQSANELGLDAASVGGLLRTLRSKARFAPPKSDPDRDWYLSHVSD
jgi:predicted nucleic acid-binding protein